MPGFKITVHHQGWEKVVENSSKEPKTGNNRSVKVMDMDQEFCFEIRFENVRAWELGLMIYVLNLENGLAHKLGIGKALGFGSVQIHVNKLASDSEISIEEIQKAAQNKFQDIWKNDKANIPEKLFQLLQYVDDKNITGVCT